MADDTDNDLAVAATVVLSALSDKNKRKRDKWVQPWIVQRPIGFSKWRVSCTSTRRV